MKRSFFIFFLTITLCFHSFSKEYEMIMDIEDSFYSEFSEDDIITSTAEIEELKESLSYLSENPININSATREELENLPFLKSSQVENLLEYIFDYGPLETMYELTLIEGFDAPTIRASIAFLTVKHVEADSRFSFRKIFKNGTSHLTLYSGGTFQKKAGYSNGKYLGHPYSLYLKYYFKHKDMSIGVLGSKSEGEPFDFKYNKGFDFYSAHISFSNICKYVKKLVIGDYRMVFGQGLVFKSNSSFMNTTIESAIVSTDNIRASYSTSETGYYRGAAMQIGGKYVNLSILSSFTFYNKGEGYHRTISDFEKRYSTPSYMLGGNINYSSKYFKLGFSGFYDFYDKWFNAGVDYRFRIGKFRIAGETAIDKNLKVATVNSFSVICNDYVSFSALLRYYQLGFKTKYGNAYSRNSITDETGFYIGVDFIPFRNWKILTYADIYRVSFIKSTIYKPSVGFRFNIKGIYNPNSNNLAYIRYGFTSKEKNLSGHGSVKETSIYQKHYLTLNYKATILNYFTLTSTISASICVIDSLNNSKKISYGYLLSTNGCWNTKNEKFFITLGSSFFDIPVYDNVIYNYEPSVLYSYSSPKYYGIGCRFILVLKYNPVKNLTLNLKLSDTYLIDRDEIGSGNECIKGNHKTEIKGVVSYKF